MMTLDTEQRFVSTTARVDSVLALLTCCVSWLAMRSVCRRMSLSASTTTPPSSGNVSGQAWEPSSQGGGGGQTPKDGMYKSSILLNAWQ